MGLFDHLVKDAGKVFNDIGENTANFIKDTGNNVNNMMKSTEEISQNAMMETLNWSYDRVIEGLPGEKTLDDLIDDYLSKYSKDEAIEKLIQFQTTKAATSGFITGFGGLLTMPIAIPANVTTVILFQMRMIAAIAKIRGYDLQSDQVQTFVYTTLAGCSLSEITKKAGIVLGNKLAIGMIKKIPGKLLVKINQAVGFRLATKFGQKGIINLGKMVPVVGAVVGGGFDSVTTLTIGNLAKKTFTDIGVDIGDGLIVSKEDLETVNQDNSAEE